MNKPEDIDPLLRGWDYTAGEILARMVHARDGREVIQVRVDLGILQLETDARPDGSKPHGYESYYDYLVAAVVRDGKEFVLTEEHQVEIDREFLQYYQRRICWLSLRQFGRAVQDADHNLALLDFIGEHSTNDEWLSAHEQYRPFILFHRTQASALAALESSGPEKATEELNGGLDRIRQVFVDHDAEELYEENEMVQRLEQLRDALRKEYDFGPTLEERLEEAVRNEDYELAARLRDEILHRDEGR